MKEERNCDQCKNFNGYVESRDRTYEDRKDNIKESLFHIDCQVISKVKSSLFSYEEIYEITKQEIDSDKERKYNFGQICPYFEAREEKKINTLIAERKKDTINNYFLQSDLEKDFKVLNSLPKLDQNIIFNNVILLKSREQSVVDAYRDSEGHEMVSTELIINKVKLFLSRRYQEAMTELTPIAKTLAKNQKLYLHNKIVNHVVKIVDKIELDNNISDALKLDLYAKAQEVVGGNERENQENTGNVININLSSKGDTFDYVPTEPLIPEDDNKNE